MIASSVAKSVARSVASSTAGIASGGSGLPAGAVGAWFADEYQSAPRPYMPNSVVSEPPSSNLILSPRRQFNQTAFYSNSGVTITDNGADGPLAADVGQASIVTGSGAWYVSPAGNTVVLTAGTYTVAVDVRWRGTGDASFQLGSIIAGGLTTKTATSSWQRFSAQFTSTGTARFPAMYAAGGSSVANFEIINFEVFSGASDLGTGVQDSNLYLGKAGLSLPSVSGDLLDCTSGGLACLQFASSLDLSSGITVAYLAKRTATGFNRAFQPVISSSQGGSWQTLSVGGDFNGTGAGIYATTFHGADQQNGYLIDYQGNDFVCIVHRYNGTKVDTFVNGQLLLTDTDTFSLPSVKDFFVSNLQFGQYYSGDKLNSLAIWGRGLTDDEVQSTNRALINRLESVGYTVPADRFVIFLGDSIGYGSNGLPGYASKYAANASPRIRGTNLSVGGAVVSTMSAINASRVLPLIASMQDSGAYVICHVNLGVNDMRSFDAATFLSSYAAYLDTLMATGAKVVVNTCSPSTTAGALSAGYEARRSTANAAIRTWVGTHIDAYCDIAADATMGPEAAADDASLYADKLHPTTLGHSNFEAIIRPVLDVI